MNLDVEMFREKPQTIHDEFGSILDDLTSNVENNHRIRPLVPWRANASSHYIRKVMRYQSNYPNYDEHKITGYYHKQ